MINSQPVRDHWQRVGMAFISEHLTYFPIRARSRSCFFSGSGVKLPGPPGAKSHALVGSPN
jgi:hypothetical protein